MRTQAEMEVRIAEILADERTQYETATILENAPLALIQIEGEVTVNALRWALGETRWCAGSFPTKEATHG